MTVQNPSKRSKSKSEWWLGEPVFSLDFPDQFWPEERLGSQWQLRVYLGLVDDKIACTGIDLRSFMDNGAGPEPLPERDAFAALNSSSWRSVPIGWYVDRAIALQRDSESATAREVRAGFYDQDVDDPERVAALHEDLAQTAPHGRRGRSSALTDSLMRDVVVPAYRSGGRRPTVAVQQALTAHGFPGAGADGGVTIDQARKAVQRARRIGVIPPAPNNRKARP